MENNNYTLAYMLEQNIFQLNKNNISISGIAECSKFNFNLPITIIPNDTNIIINNYNLTQYGLILNNTNISRNIK
jgi:hypothetical protein